MLLELWMVRAHKAARAHYMQASIHRLKDMRLTIVNAVAAILVLYFSNASWIEELINGDSDTDNFLGDFTLYTMISGLLAAIVVVTTILQFMKRWGERSDIHKLAGAEFSNFQRKTERYLLSNEINMAMIHNLNRDYNHATKIYPLVNSAIWDSAGESDLNNRIRDLESCLRGTDLGSTAAE